MNAIMIIVILFIALAVLVPLLERYQQQLGLNKMTKYGKYILPLVAVSLVVKLIYVLVNQ